MLDNARDLVAAAEPAQDASAPTTVARAVDGELPPPDASRFVGANRVVNLLTDADGGPVDVDVWGRRTFDNGPILLVDGLGFGEASDHVAAPSEYTIVAVGAGAGPDGLALAEVVNAVEGERITTVVVAGDDGAPSAKHLFERGTDAAVVPPAPGSGLLVVDAPNLEAFDAELESSFGSDRVEVGDGSGACLRQRREDVGLVPDIVGDPEPIEIEVAPGTVGLSVHPWSPTAEPCSLPSIHETTATIADGEAVLVLVARMPDGSIGSVSLPFG